MSYIEHQSEAKKELGRVQHFKLNNGRREKTRFGLILSADCWIKLRDLDNTLESQ
jgi:hypothetical protein